MGKKEIGEASDGINTPLAMSVFIISTFGEATWDGFAVYSSWQPDESITVKKRCTKDCFNPKMTDKRAYPK